MAKSINQTTVKLTNNPSSLSRKSPLLVYNIHARKSCNHSSSPLVSPAGISRDTPESFEPRLRNSLAKKKKKEKKKKTTENHLHLHLLIYMVCKCSTHLLLPQRDLQPVDGDLERHFLLLDPLGLELVLQTNQRTHVCYTYTHIQLYTRNSFSREIIYMCTHVTCCIKV